MATIGITLHAPDAQDSEELDFLVSQIAQAVTVAGGTPVLIPPGWDTATLRAQFSALDGILLSGGGDIDPACYGSTPIASVGGVDPDRDRTELTLAQWALAENKPIFGICRGLQLLNVACGGTLYRDVSEHANAIRHTYTPGYPADLLAHPVEIVEDSMLAAIVGKRDANVNSLHHQACNEIAPGLRVVAQAPDGMVEAVEVPDHRFVLAVQWHPEALPAAAESEALFRAFVAASAGHQPG
jgi:putative glutamine amidotransferase